MHLFSFYYNLLKGDAMKLSARNQLKGKIVDIKEGAVNGHVVLELPGGERIKGSITNEAINELGLSVGSEAYAVIKASDVMFAID